MNPVKGLSGTPDVIKLEILRGLGANDLCKVATLCKSWQKLPDHKPLWTQLASKLKIRIINPENPKNEVVEFWKRLPEINKKFAREIGVTSASKDPFEQHQAMLEEIKNLSKDLKKMVFHVNDEPTRTDLLILQIALDLGIIPFTNYLHPWSGKEWCNYIYFIDSTMAFEQYFAYMEPEFYIGSHRTSHFESLLSNSIRYCNIPFIKFLLDRLEKVPPKDGVPIDWARIYIISWIRAFEGGLDPNNPAIQSMLPLFDKYQTLDPKTKYKLYGEEGHARMVFIKMDFERDKKIRSVQDHNNDLAKINTGMAFLRKHFLPKK